MFKLIAFDIDNTLADINKPIDEATVRFLRELEERGCRVALISGKPAIYLSGMARQLGLSDPVIVGENGATIFYSLSVPPRGEIVVDVSREERELLASFKASVTECFGDSIWFQPNSLCVTCFPKTPDTGAELYRYVRGLCTQGGGFERLDIYIHSDSVDVVPAGLNKGTAIKALMKAEGLSPEEIIAVGDGENDFPMFAEAGVSIGIGIRDRHAVTKDFDTIEKAAEYIRGLLAAREAK